MVVVSVDVWLLAAPDPDQVRPGVLGLLVVLALIAATVLLLRSFTKQLRKIDFDEEPPGDEDGTRGTGR